MEKDRLTTVLAIICAALIVGSYFMCEAAYNQGQKDSSTNEISDYELDYHAIYDTGFSKGFDRGYDIGYDNGYEDAKE